MNREQQIKNNMEQWNNDDWKIFGRSPLNKDPEAREMYYKSAVSALERFEEKHGHRNIENEVLLDPEMLQEFANENFDGFVLDELNALTSHVANA